MQYSKLLMTHDGSALADAAIAHTAALAAATNAEVVLLHVTETVGQEMAGFGAGAWMGGEAVGQIAVQEVARLDAEAQAQLDAVKAKLIAAGVTRVSTMVVEGYPGPTVVEIAARERCDLIVMATHGRSGLKRAVIGSVADHVVRHAGCPVLLCQPAA